MSIDPRNSPTGAPDSNLSTDGSAATEAAMSARVMSTLLTTPRAFDDLLHQVVEISMHIVESQAAALFLLEDGEAELSCRVSIGGNGDVLLGVRVPVGQGIVGYVAASHDPLTANDPAAAFSTSSMAWQPRNLLCVPVLDGDHLLGALELCDRTRGGEPRPYTPADTDTLLNFVPLAARALTLSRAIESIASPDTGAGAAEGGEELSGELSRSLELARLVRGITAHGEIASQGCIALLRGFADYLNATSLAPPGAASTASTTSSGGSSS